MIMIDKLTLKEKNPCRINRSKNVFNEFINYIKENRLRDRICNDAMITEQTCKYELTGISVN